MARVRRSKTAQNDFFPGFADIAEIGIGSLATVYRAREAATNRQVALKLLNVRDASPRALESFERESIALGAVSSHPNIVTLYRSFRAADNRPVLVLELCHGAVSDRMHNGQGLPVTEVVAMGIKIAGALETAHRAAILHRDVKPQNILITEFGEPALADFGVAMLQSSTQTTAGLFDFTTLHAAPELLEGGETSAATDVYELASSLYQLIAGRSAFRAYDGESPASVILRILRDPVLPLVNANVPTQLSDLLIHAMSKDKAARPPTAAEFASELATIESNEGWPRTQFLIRDPRSPGGVTGGAPSITRLPEVRPRSPYAAPAYSPSAPPPSAPPDMTQVAGAAREPMYPPVPSPPPPPPPAEPVAPAATGPVRPGDDADWTTPVLSEHPAAMVSALAPRPNEAVAPPPVADDLDAPSQWIPSPARARASAAPAPAAVPVSPTPDPSARPDPAYPPQPAEQELGEPPELVTNTAYPIATHVVRPADTQIRAVPGGAAAAPPAATPPTSSSVPVPAAVPTALIATQAPADLGGAEPGLPDRDRATHLRVPIRPEDTPAVPPLPAPGLPSAVPPPSAPPSAAPPSAVPPSAVPPMGGPPPWERTGERILRPPAEGPPPYPANPVPPPPMAQWETTAQVNLRTGAPVGPPGSDPAQSYPIPPQTDAVHTAPRPLGEPPPEPQAAAPAVPTWSNRAAGPQAVPAQPQFVGDLSLDPMSLRRKLTIRSGTSAVRVDEEKLAIRSWWKRTEIPWSQITGFEPRLADGGDGGRLTAHTLDGPVELPATKRDLADLRYLHALLDAYRLRAQLMRRS